MFIKNLVLVLTEPKISVSFKRWGYNDRKLYKVRYLCRLFSCSVLLIIGWFLILIFTCLVMYLAE